ASRQAAGAGGTLTAPAAGRGLPPAAPRALPRVPGVQRAVTVSVTTGTSGLGQSLPVAIVDPRSYAALTAATPLPRFPAAALAQPGAPGTAARVPVLVSPAARHRLRSGSSLYSAGRTVRVRGAGRPGSLLGGA